MKKKSGESSMGNGGGNLSHQKNLFVCLKKVKTIKHIPEKLDKRTSTKDFTRISTILNDEKNVSVRQKQLFVYLKKIKIKDIPENRDKLYKENRGTSTKVVTNSPINSNDEKFTTGTNQVQNALKNMLEKLKQTAPYNLFFTIGKAPENVTQPNTISFIDLLCPSLGTLKCSLQINFTIDIDWLISEYRKRNVHEKPLTLIYGTDKQDLSEFDQLMHPNIIRKLIQLKNFGIHHSKIGIYVYEDLSLRIVVSTANLFYEDWSNYSQGLWMSPNCPRLPDSSSCTDGESTTGFKSMLIDYLRTYELTDLEPFVEFVKKADFSAIKVCLVYSVPGTHCIQDKKSHLHTVTDLLSHHCILPPNEDPLTWNIIAQASSIGVLGNWLRTSFLKCLANHKHLQMEHTAKLKLVYPSLNNLKNGYFGTKSGACLFYSKSIHKKQGWLKTYLHQWKADAYGCTRAMPHIKTYCRISPCSKQLAYYLLTSANLSKSAWGEPLFGNKHIYVRSYEIGVMFLPTFFNKKHFEIETALGRKEFPFLNDLPLTPYSDSDEPSCTPFF